MTISLCMIVKNEETHLTDCLDSVCDLVDEINIVDTGSTDKTVEIAKKYTDRIFHFKWIDDFAAARNYAFSKATKEYIMWLDADDIIDDKNRRLFKAFKEQLTDKPDFIFMDYITDWDEAGRPKFMTSRERIVKREKNFKWVRPIHEILSTSGDSIKSEICILHKPKDNPDHMDRNMRILKKIIDSGEGTFVDHYYYGIALGLKNKHKEALLHLLLFINNNTDENFTGVDAFMYAFRSYTELGDYENAYRILATHEHENRDKAEYYTLLGRFMFHFMNDTKLAEEYFLKALKCTGLETNMKTCIRRNEDFYYYEPLYSLGQLYIKTGAYAKAKSAYEQAITYRPENTELKALITKLNELLNKIGS